MMGMNAAVGPYTWYLDPQHCADQGGDRAADDPHLRLQSAGDRQPIQRDRDHRDDQPGGEIPEHVEIPAADPQIFVAASNGLRKNLSVRHMRSVSCREYESTGNVSGSLSKSRTGHRGAEPMGWAARNVQSRRYDQTVAQNSRDSLAVAELFGCPWLIATAMVEYIRNFEFSIPSD